MGKKKKKPSKPWCWYCDREFEDEKILINHQKAKHFKCYQCHKKLTTATGLAIHLYSVHKESISTVPNAKEGRDALKPDIIGMDGVPEDAVRGQAAAGSDDEDGQKKPRVEPGQPIPKPYIPPPSNTLPTISQLGPPPPAPSPFLKPAGGASAPLLSTAAVAAAAAASPLAPAPAPGPGHMMGNPPGMMGGPPGMMGNPPGMMPHHMHPGGYPGGPPMGYHGGPPPPYGYPPPPYGYPPPGYHMPMPQINPALARGYPPQQMYNQPPPQAPQNVAPPAFAAYANPAAAAGAPPPRPQADDGFIPVNTPAAAASPSAPPAAAAPAATPAPAAAAGATLMVYDDEFQSPEERRASLRRYSFEPK